MSIRFLPANHLLLRENADPYDEGAADFDDDGTVLTIIDDHGRAFDQPEPHLLSIALPKDVALLRDLERYIPRIREHSLADAYEAMREVLSRRRGFSDTEIEHLLDEVREFAEKPRVPAGWTVWSAVPAGSLSAFGDGQYLLRWPMGLRGKLDTARFEYVEPSPEERVAGPEFTFAPERPSVPWVKVLRTGLTSDQIAAYLAAPVIQGETAEQAFARLCPPEVT